MALGDKNPMQRQVYTTLKPLKHLNSVKYYRFLLIHQL